MSYSQTTSPNPLSITTNIPGELNVPGTANIGNLDNGANNFAILNNAVQLTQSGTNGPVTLSTDGTNVVTFSNTSVDFLQPLVVNTSLAVNGPITATGGFSYDGNGNLTVPNTINSLQFVGAAFKQVISATGNLTLSLNNIGGTYLYFNLAGGNIVLTLTISPFTVVGLNNGIYSLNCCAYGGSGSNTATITCNNSGYNVTLGSIVMTPASGAVVQRTLNLVTTGSNSFDLF
jgi:hypothetical protein